MHISANNLKGNPDFQLIETMIFRHRIRFFEDHLDRMRLSARVFQIPLNAEVIHSKVTDVINTLDRNAAYKIRMTLDLAGEVFCEKTKVFPENETEKKLCISPIKVDSRDIFFFHKTTRRELYDTEYIRAQKKGYYDILFLNQEAKITEASRNNVFVRIGNKTYTPPLRNGLLGGVYRKKLLQRSGKIIEAELSLPDLRQATAIYLSNAVRGLRKIDAPFTLPELKL